MRFTLQIWRQKNGRTGGQMMSYNVADISPDMSFLEMLDKLGDELIEKGEEPIAFDSDCREGICGMCSLVINGVPHGHEQGTATCQLHMRMFDDGEIAIFRKYGLQPVFFGETIVGPKMPNLTYMVAYDDWAEREKAWRRFVTSPEWRKLSKTPGLSDAEVVSNISNGLYRPVSGSDIK